MANRPSLENIPIIEPSEVVDPASVSASLEKTKPAKTASAAKPIAAKTHAGMKPALKTKSSPEKTGMPWWMKLLWTIVVLVLVLSLGALGLIAFKYWQGQHDYDKVTEDAFSMSLGGTLDAVSDTEGVLLSDIVVDWDALRAINEDVVGWVYIPGTVVNYPIVQGDDNVEYLTRDFQGNQGGSWLPTYGSIFLTAENDDDFYDDNNIIQGHNLQNGSMFAFIANEMKKQDVFDEHNRVYVFTPQGNYCLGAFAIVHTQPYERIVTPNFDTASDMVAYIEDKMARTLVKPSESVPASTAITQLFTFSTCDEYSSGAHYVLFCYVVDYAPVGDPNPDDGVLVDPNTESAVDDAVNEQ